MNDAITKSDEQVAYELKARKVAAVAYRYIALVHGKQTGFLGDLMWMLYEHDIFPKLRKEAHHEYSEQFDTTKDLVAVLNLIQSILLPDEPPIKL